MGAVILHGRRRNPSDPGLFEVIDGQQRITWRSGAPTSIYPFLMPLSKAVQLKKLSDEKAIEVLEAIESFLIRRGVLGLEPTGLHSVFKRLWTDCHEKPSKESVIKELSKHKTVAWPSDEEFKNAICKRPLYGVGITHYVLLEHDKSLGGDQPQDIPWIEHVLPENPAKQWFKLFTKEQHHSQKDLLANLIPLSQHMNASLANKPYGDKRQRYREDSMFKSPRAFADKFAEWTPDRIERRGQELASWAVTRWNV